MTELWWVISEEARVALKQFQWRHFKTKLNMPDEPKQEPRNPELEPEPDPELVRDMQKPPHSPRYPK